MVYTIKRGIIIFYYLNQIMDFNKHAFYNYFKYYSVLFKFFTFKVLTYIVCNNIKRF